MTARKPTPVVVDELTACLVDTLLPLVEQVVRKKSRHFVESLVEAMADRIRAERAQEEEG